MHDSFPPPFESDEEKVETFIEGRDFYFDTGLMVLTRRYLVNQGTCCGSDCRHCPYEGVEKR